MEGSGLQRMLDYQRLCGVIIIHMHTHTCLQIIIIIHMHVHTCLQIILRIHTHTCTQIISQIHTKGLTCPCHMGQQSCTRKVAQRKRRSTSCSSKSCSCSSSGSRKEESRVSTVQYCRLRRRMEDRRSTSVIGYTSCKAYQRIVHHQMASAVLVLLRCSLLSSHTRYIHQPCGQSCVYSLFVSRSIAGF